MPFLKNTEKVICQVYDNEIKPLLEKGWKELTTLEEDAYREGLALDHSLTSAVAIESTRVKAGVYKALGQVKSTVQTAEKSVSKGLASLVGSKKQKVASKTIKVNKG